MASNTVGAEERVNNSKSCNRAMHQRIPTQTFSKYDANEFSLNLQN